MAEPIRIQVDSESDALDLSFALALRGLSGTFLPEEGWSIEIPHEREQTNRRLADVSAVLVDWLADRDCGNVTVYAGDRASVLRRRKAEPDKAVTNEASDSVLGTDRDI
jgi:hypothetical protein